MPIVGCCGFPLSRKEYFATFASVEVQSTFYNIPQRRTVERWRDEAPEGFIYNIKAFQGITHPPRSGTYRRYRGEKRDDFGFFRRTEGVEWSWEKTLEVADILGAKYIIIQAPGSFKENEENVANLREFLDSTRGCGHKIGLELRGNWDVETIKALVREYGISHVTDPFTSPSITGDYYRLHGSPPGKRMYNYSYSDDDLQRLRTMVGEDSFVMFNNMSMAQDARRFMEILDANAMI